jgi:hypothetical protein
MEEKECPPNASMLIESTRSVGYSFESAIADIIDNCISAFADLIEIKSTPSLDPYVAILDNGEGMSKNELFEAMRYGSDPNEVRSEHDLGRFGLGLKMASLSQCRSLTVASMKDGNLSSCRWDIDCIIASNEWVLQILDRNDIKNLPLLAELEKKSHGTLVVWERLDRVLGRAEEIDEAMAENLQIVRQHIALTFHRFLSGEPGLKKITVILNGSPIEASDPFLSKHPTTNPLPEQRIRIKGEDILIKPYILPPPSKISPSDSRLMGGKDNLRRLQGFYIYRNKRLIIPGTWFRLTSTTELRNLARVRVDIPSSLDFLWDIDIKKSSATLPSQYKDSFLQFLSNVTASSERVYHFRGRKVSDSTKTYVWDKLDCRGCYKYVINREHPLVCKVKVDLSDDQRRELDSLLEIIERSVPYPAIYADMGGGTELGDRGTSEDLEETLYALGVVLIKSGTPVSELSKIEPFYHYKKVLDKLGEMNDGPSIP